MFDSNNLKKTEFSNQYLFRSKSNSKKTDEKDTLCVK